MYGPFFNGRFEFMKLPLVVHGKRLALGSGISCTVLLSSTFEASIQVQMDNFARPGQEYLEIIEKARMAVK